ncbi:hypothetical protein NQ318_014321 [Aromia moschata]|uniref:Fructose-bisphosphatase n=1 Tax=Aromia moschata TaxID=1265417 RepID=A0AAV8YZ71_9CUCU|nr:hypothetical protein NQ318_014321 [Aromia moschata]
MYTYVQKLYQSTRLLDKRPIHAVHLVVEAARVAKIVASAVSSPQRSVDGTAIDAFPTFGESI